MCVFHDLEIFTIMRKYSLYSLFFLIGIVLISGCSPKVYFTGDIRQKMDENKIKMTDVQYYNDRQLVLRRELTSGDVNVTAGKIKIENGRYINEIVIKKLTPAICVEEGTNTLKVTFEEGPGKVISFGVDGKSKSAQTLPYQIQADDWIKDFGKVFYDGQVYFITPGGSETKLLISKTKLEKTSIDKRYAKGVKVQ